MPEPVYIVCPACKGEGILHEQASTAGPSPFDREGVCWLCKGHKEVTERKAEQWRQERNKVWPEGRVA